MSPILGIPVILKRLGRTITEYKGVVFGEVISGVNFLRDFAASIRHGRQAGMK